MDTSALKKFAQAARNLLIDQVASKLDAVLAENSTARRAAPQAVKDLEKAIQRTGQQQVIEQVAYTWFNRFTALRFMDANGYTQVRVVSPADNATRPEILSEAMAGNLPEGAPAHIQALLDGRTPSNDPQAEAYRLLLVHACNQWHGPMPFLFEEIDDFTELLMPEDLLSQSSILANLREAMTPDACEDVEIIGWLYQFYISEKKDEVFAGLKKNKKITPENIPAATQLFTPHWIVRYLVENSLGRLWMLNHPQSNLTDKMDYYIAPVEPEEDFLRISSPEEIKICDPACGSGHMLTYAFDLLHAIYEEEGYDPSEIPALILTNNLFGIEIDERAGALAAFALTMKARARQRRFFRKSVRPNICVLQDVRFEPQELEEYTAKVGRDLFTSDLRETLGQFAEAKNFGSLIVPALKDVGEVARVVKAQDFEGNLFLRATHNRVQTVLRMADYLSPKYHVVVANPPYMGGKGMNGRLKSYLADNFKDVKSDLFSAFIVRNTQMTLPKGQLGFMTPFVWMFISSYEKLRLFLLEQKTITSLIQLEYSGFSGATVPICTFTLENAPRPDFMGGYVRLSDFRGAINQAPKALEAIRNPDCGWFYRASAEDFNKIPGSPIAYWVSKAGLGIFEKYKSLGELVEPRQGMATTNNNKFLRLWHEVSLYGIGIGFSSTEAASTSGKTWFSYNKGGDFRKWYGNNFYIVNYGNDGYDLKIEVKAKYREKDYAKGFSDERWDKLIEVWVLKNQQFYFQPSVTWTYISSAYFGARYCPRGFIFDVGGSSIFPNEHEISNYTGFMCSKLSTYFLSALNPTLNFQVENIGALPISDQLISIDNSPATKNVDLAKSDWDAFETSWDFTTLPLLHPDTRQPTLAATYANLRQHWQQMTDEMRALEQENNRIFIDAYGLQDELDADVPLEEITLTCNPAYRYRGNDDLEGKLCADTMREFLSYAVGCMFGRYSLDAPGLILANQGETLADYLTRVPNPTFTPDEDNVIPILDGDWFPDDITERFRLFLRTTFGEAHFRENLRSIEEALGKDIRKYFTKDFYADHVKRYKKRPIYWMFSSPKGTFNALIYMHRYQSDTVSVILNDYLREFITRLEGERARLDKLADDPTATQGQKTKAIKDASAVAKQLVELNAWERDVIFPLAQQKIEIDLDDGVKANYPKFGSALKKIVGVSQ